MSKESRRARRARRKAAGKKSFFGTLLQKASGVLESVIGIDVYQTIDSVVDSIKGEDGKAQLPRVVLPTPGLLGMPGGGLEMTGIQIGTGLRGASFSGAVDTNDGVVKDAKDLFGNMGGVIKWAVIGYIVLKVIK